MNSSQTSATSNYEEDVLDIIKSFSSLDYEEGYEHPIVYRNCYSSNPSAFQFFEENKFFIKPVNQCSAIGMCKRLWLNTYSFIKNIWRGVVKEHVNPFDEPDKIFQFVNLDVKLGRYSSKYNFDKIATLSTWAREITIDRINCGLLNESFKNCGLT